MLVSHPRNAALSALYCDAARGGQALPRAKELNGVACLLFALLHFGVDVQLPWRDGTAGAATSRKDPFRSPS